ncbi:sensor domain-containing phosphodiesterase [Sphingobium fuliginis]|uniref:Diguanylate cyclase n=1 Tax=Sphingobium fuliginis (strain ATCC 27551) TaxID=336203 RepID=A0A292ZBE0_SPHSA|nr:EAL domain-containing protein [Sphingobium fuliginis]GAY20095.1 diguanylate cyclase [Sphingobium fuliginis]
MLLLQKTILEMIARGDALKSTLQQLCLQLEARFSETICSIVTVDAAGLLHTVAAPSLPSEYVSRIEGIPAGPMAGSCGSAIFHGQSVSVCDIAADPRWAIVRPDALRAGLAACWSYPITDSSGRILGAFALYFREARGPTRAEQEIVEACLDLAVIALERQARVAEREHRATHDQLTGLPNLSAFSALIARLPCDAPGSWGLLAIDVDNLKPVNDTYGHHAGDCLLKIVAQRIKTAVAPDLIFRIGGDEFMVVLRAPLHLGEMESFVESLLDDLGRPAECGGFWITPQASIGGAIVAADDAIPETVRQNADHALYCAKETRRGGFVRYWPGLGSPITERVRQIREIEAALQQGRVEPWYQPIMCLDTGRFVGLEALCRVRTISGSIRPAAAYGLGDSEAGIAYELTRRMLAMVAGDFSSWAGMDGAPDYVAVNVTSADLRIPGLTEELLKILTDQNLAARHLVLDLNETTHLGLREKQTLGAIQQLRASGIRIALDDFGSGLASLSHLMNVPVDMIKLDPSLTNNRGDEGKAEAIISGMLDISKRLGIEVIAEAVETHAQHAWLMSLGCRFAQGYHYSRAIPRTAMGKWLYRQSVASMGEVNARQA